MSKVIRSVKNVTKGYSSVQVKVRDATSNDAWGPTGTQMSEIAQLTYNSSTEFYEIMDMLDKRLNDKGKNWRHVLKALKVLDYCLHEGSELVVTWAKQNIYIIKTLREFMYVDEDGKDVGQNVRVAAKELTSLILDDERLRVERTDRRSWKSRVHGLDEQGPPPGERRPRRRPSNEDDAEYRLAIEASKRQEEEDRRKRASRSGDTEDDDLAKAIKLSKEEEERRRHELEESNNTSLFDDDLIQVSQPTGFNQGYQQGSAVDFFANPIEQTQPTGYMSQGYPGFMNQPTGYQNGFQNGYGTGFDPYAQQNIQYQQPTGFNPYAQQSPVQQEPTPTGSNNPWASANAGAMKPMATGSNNPFAARPQAVKATTLSSLPEQKALASFGQPTNFTPTSFTPPPQPTQPMPMPQPVQQPLQLQQPQRELSEHEAKLNALLAGGDGLDTFGNTGQLRIPAQHTAPGTFVNSAGANLNRLTAEATGSNPFLRTQFTGMPTVSYGGQQMPAATGPAGMNGRSNPFAARQQQQQQQGNQGDLIQF